ncbi:ABC-type dipeptide/oligopeptide/nickel transport system ATPase subunit [Salana multivorans]|uniref:ABC-type dipeptide/oligopeptide/nickel transport system ATPase subunit n=1 Tax=Salana multivorans TaxID=120377 RepID=A0A3N2D8K1_9MICO|nr:ATP-binding cassette domain-containing protein [Salana multivorans]OJX97498.1 MAG: ABC transporter [Micrococcales bacterium 73-15]ROR96115.1 ABC-type dipeptide/oligopeptide/nickel transport system ATPase subunit [Salana multivorans]
MATAGETVLAAYDLGVSYGYEPVLRGVDLELRAGAAPVGVIGPSGAGKTTLINALRGVITPSSGRVSFHGKPLPGKLARKDKHRFAGSVRSVSQNGILLRDPRLTVQSYLSGALKEARRAGRTHPTTVESLLNFVALNASYSGRAIATLSGGEKQRVALAHALATRPDVLLLDEPLTAIDPGLRAEVLRRLGTLAQDLGISVLVVSHDLEAVERLCETVHVLADGTFVASGPLREVLIKGRHPVVVDLRQAAPLTAQRLR